MGRLFGTDGARGIANTELTCELAMNIGKAAAMVLTDETHKRPMVLIGKDTRMSSDMLESALAAGLCSVGADVCSLGVVPTPAVAYLVRLYGADAGVMISASHNPCEFNGIKIFNSQGYKLSDALEEEIENIVIDNAKPYNLKIGGDVGKVTMAPNAAQDYIDSVKKTVSENFDGLKIAIDCANGSSSVTAKKLFEDLGAQAILLAASPNGVNINANCGSTHMDHLRNFVVNNNLDIGLAFDGDADRFLAVDELGNLVDGDQLIAICAKYLKTEGKLNFDTAVVTVMSNLGFFKFCEREGIQTAKTKVGDRYVLEEMLKHRYTIGGEQSGHIIFHDYATTGDGQLTAVQLLSILKKTGKTLSELAAEMTKYPQTMINVKVSAIGKARFDDDKEIKLAITTAEKELGDDGRILVRISGTEPLIRVMVEGIDKQQIERIASEIAEVVRERLI